MYRCGYSTTFPQRLQDAGCTIFGAHSQFETARARQTKGEVSAMDRKYTDMYSLFRHEPGAEDYFEALPSYVQDQIAPRYRAVDSFARLENYADRFSHSYR